jgi:hypothetical protein
MDKNIRYINNLKRSNMDFAVGFAVGAFITWAIAKRLMIELKRELEKLKDFDTWKEWKNK